LPKPGKDPKFHKNSRPISLLSTTGKLFEKEILKILQKHFEEKGLLNATAAVFLYIEKSFDTTWHSGLLFKLLKLEFSINLIKLLGSFLSQRKFRVSVKGEMSTPRVIKAGVPQGSVLSPTLFKIYINDAPQTRSFHLALFADDSCLYATDRRGGFC
jgi:hypothetical protein